MSTVETLTAIWQRVLQRPNIGPNEIFHDIGGTDRRADDLFEEIARVCGRELPSSTINHASTIADLAAILDRAELPQFSPFVKIKNGTQKPPVFIAHGLAGTVEFFELARHIRTEHSVYGIQAKGVDGLADPLESVHDMADYYISALADVWPNGPYLLVGYSYGGLVALEMARRLLEAGKTISMLALIDTYPHPHYLSRDQRIRLVLQRVRGHGREMLHLPRQKAFAYFLRGFRRRLHISGADEEYEQRPGALPWSLNRTVPRVKKMALRGYAKYQPKFYPGKVKFITTSVKSFFPSDPPTVWSSLIGELEVEVIPGDHLQVVRTHFEGLAAVLTRFIEEAMVPLKASVL